MDAVTFSAGGYRYLPGVFQYSAGVAAAPGFVIERACFTMPRALSDGFATVEAFLAARQRPMTAFCACELRSPAPFTEQGFADFNRHYVRTLEGWGLYRDGVNPVARTNVCPVIEPPPVPSLLAFSYTVPADSQQPGTFVIAGSGEARDGGPSYRESVVRLGDVSMDGLRHKVRYVVDEMNRRLGSLGFSWSDATAIHAYTAHDIGPLVRDELFGRGVARNGLTWDHARPPIVDIEFEMDVRRPLVDRLLDA